MKKTILFRVVFVLVCDDCDRSVAAVGARPAWRSRWGRRIPRRRRRISWRWRSELSRRWRFQWRRPLCVRRRTLVRWISWGLLRRARLLRRAGLLWRSRRLRLGLRVGRQILGPRIWLRMGLGSWFWVAILGLGMGISLRLLLQPLVLRAWSLLFLPVLRSFG